MVRYEGAVRDITDQKRAEDAIAEGRRLLQQVIDTVPAVINVKDRSLRYVLMNRYMAGIFGVDPSEAIGRTTTDLMSRYGAQKTDENDQRVLKIKGELGFYEEEYLDSAGHLRQWLVNKLPLLDADGEIDKHRDRCARYRRTQAQRAGDAQGARLRRDRAAQSARDPGFADRGRKARRARTLGGRRRARGQQPRRHQPDGRFCAGAEDLEFRRRGRARRSAPLEPE